MSLLRVDGLEVTFQTLDGPVRAVRGVGFSVDAGETLGIVGETGCGKSVAVSSLMGLVAGTVQASVLTFGERSLLRADGRLDATAAASVRGSGMGMVFQDPATALNPVFPVGDMLGAVIRRYQPGVDPKKRAVEWLDHVGLPEPAALLGRYPHQLSGGQKQRAAIATALAAGPRLLLADEPTTALDVTVQAQVLALMRHLQDETGVGMIFITHDLGIVAEMCHRVSVMYAGRVVEEASVEVLFDAPAHPYTRGLFAARPSTREAVASGVRGRLAAIPGAVPPPSRLPTGCAFHPRCPRAQDRCRAEDPVLESIGEGHRVACFFPETRPLAEGASDAP